MQRKLSLSLLPELLISRCMGKLSARLLTPGSTRAGLKATPLHPSRLSLCKENLNSETLGVWASKKTEIIKVVTVPEH